MTDSSLPGRAELSSPDVYVDRVCNRFEAAWRGPSRPRIEDFLGPAPAAERATLLHELVQIEVEYRRSRGEDCRLEEYLARFPALEAAWLAEALGEGAAGRPAAGRYVLVSFHAGGGLGEVHIAFDRELRRRVALKRIRPQHHANPDSRRRFLSEAEVTGRLEHPGIVPVYSLEQEADGQLGYAMRFIEGASLRDALQHFHGADRAGRPPGEQRMALRQLLTRFVTVCQTVAYAHSRGVVHRDLKPPNILLGKYGETLVVDWGLAKVLEPAGTSGDNGPQEAAAAGADLAEASTQVGQVLGTPGYMSPEQAAGRGDVVGPAGDIYSLGATLYAVLTGRAPFQGDTPEAAVTQTVRGDFLLPRQVNRQVPRALEAICLKAMASRPEQRYGTAQELADDVEHWLADEPVSAYREGWPTRLGRWARRRKPLVAGAAALLVAAVGFLVVAQVRSAAEQARTVAQWQRAETSYHLARDALDQYKRKVFDDPRLRDGPLQDLRLAALEAELSFYENFVQLRGDEPEFQAERGRAFQRLGDVNQELGSEIVALERYRQAQAIFADLVRNHPEYKTDLAHCYHTLGRLYRKTNQGPEAEQAYQSALDLRRELVQADPAAPDRRADLARCCYDLGSFYLRTDRRDPAFQAFQEALAVQTDLAQHYPKDPRYQADLASTHDELATWYWEGGQTPSAEGHYLRALRIQKDLVSRAERGRWPDEPSYQATLANIHHHLGRMYTLSNSDAWREAVQACRAAVATHDELARRHPLVTQYQAERALTYFDLGRVYNRRSLTHGAAAEQAYRQALALQKDLVERHPRIPQHQFNLARTHWWLSSLFEPTRAPEAEQSLRAALDLTDALLDQDKRNAGYLILRGQLLTARGGLLCDTGRPQEADVELGKAIALFDQLLRTNAVNSHFHSHFLFGHRRARACRAVTQARLGNLTQALAEAHDLSRVVQTARQTQLMVQAVASQAVAPPGAGALVWPQVLVSLKVATLAQPVHPDLLAPLARVYALAARAEPAGSRQREDHADRAIALLRMGISAFYEVGKLQKYPDLDVLHDREDFRKLVVEIEAREQAEGR